MILIYLHILDRENLRLIPFGKSDSDLQNTIINQVNIQTGHFYHYAPTYCTK